MGLSDYLKVLRRRWVSILVITALCVAGAIAFTLTQTKQYESSARLFVSTSDVDAQSLFQGGQFSQARVASYADLVSSRELASQVISELDLKSTPAELKGQVKASVAANTVNLTVTVTDPDPHEAQRIAQTYAEDVTDLIRELETPPGEKTAPIKATIVDAASLSNQPVSPKPVRNILLGLAIGLLLGAGWALLRETLDTRINSVDDLAEITKSPVLGIMGFDHDASRKPLISDMPSHAPRAEAFRVLRTNLQFVDVDTSHKVFVVTSSVSEEGKTTTAVNLAVSLTQAGTRTLLIDADLRRPRSAERLGLDGAVGLTTILVGQVKVGDAIQTHPDTGLSLLASGAVPPNPAELLQSNAMTELLSGLREDYDVVIVDAPPLLPVTDAALLAAKSDGALLVARHGKVTREQVRHSMARLSQVDAALVGVVLNMVPAKGSGYGYGYGYGYAPNQT